MKTYAIAAIPGDGIGKEVIAAGVEVLQALAHATEASSSSSRHFDWGSDYYKKHGVMMPEDGRDEILKARRHLFRRRRRARRAGPHHAMGVAPRDLPALRSIRQCAPDPHPAGYQGPLRMSRRRISTGSSSARTPRASMPGAVGASTGDCPRKWRQRSRSSPAPGSTRIMRFAFGLAHVPSAQAVDRRHQVERATPRMVMWDEIADEIAAEFRDVTWDKMLVDAMTMRMGMKPRNPRYGRGNQSACRYAVGSCCGTCRLARHRADGKPQSGAEVSLDVRTDSRLGLRHHRQGHRQSHRHVLVRRDDAGASRRAGRGRRA